MALLLARAAARPAAAAAVRLGPRTWAPLAMPQLSRNFSTATSLSSPRLDATIEPQLFPNLSAAKISMETMISAKDDLFNRVDTNNTGWLSREEFRNAFIEKSKISPLHLAGYTKEVDAIFDELDINGDSKISREEFHAGIETSNGLLLQVFRASVMRNELSGTDKFGETLDSGSKALSAFGNRLAVTAEVMVSKIFWAGFGWQAMSCVAAAQGFEPTTLAFALCTGIGDFMGVAAGHTTYFAIKKAVYNDKIDLGAQMQTGIFLGSAAFMSGTAWQPVVNLLQAAGIGFDASVALTGFGTGFMFFAGLRLGRLFYSQFFRGVEAPSYANLKADGMLSVAVGGATGAFVGTDVSYGDGNWLRPLAGVEDSMADIEGMVRAGSSTALGFTGAQMAQNVVVQKGKNWVD